MIPSTSMPPAVPMYGLGAGLRTQFGTLLPPGGKVVAYVHSSGYAIADDDDVRSMIFTTLNDGLKQARSGKGDSVIVLPGHAENISSANQMSNLVAGTRILGCGFGTNRPTLTWTTATSTFLFNVANTTLDNFILNMDPGTGTVNVAAPITISAAGCSITNCVVRVSTDANSKTTIPITTTAAGDDLTIANCFMYGGAGAPTTVVRLVGADRFQMFSCYISATTTAVAVGVVQCLTTASTNIRIEDCFFQNSVASSTAGFTGMTGATGQLNNCRASVLSGGAAAYATLGSLTLFNCQASNALGGGNAYAPAPQTMA